MSLLHVSPKATNPEPAARMLARLLGGEALPFPPCPGAWIAFAAQDDGTAIELYPETTRLDPGPEAIAFAQGTRDQDTSFAHVAAASALSAEEILKIGHAAGWRPRICNRGPFSCVELWMDGRILVEVLDPEMQDEYGTGMRAKNWRHMFGMEEGDPK